MNEGEVERVLPLFKSQDGAVFWWAIKLKGQENVFALNQNWFALHRALNVGDKVEYIISKAKLGYDGSQAVDREGYFLFDKLRRTKGEKTLEEEMMKLVEEGT